MKHKIFIFAVCTVALWQTSNAAWDFSFEYQGQTLYYSIHGDVVSVEHQTTSYGYYNYLSGDVVIPESVEYNNIVYPVAAIGYGAFWACDEITSVTIPSTVTSIGYRAFSGCIGLTSLEIPSSVTAIDMYVFENCTGLTAMTIPSSVISIGARPFTGCTGLTSIVVDAGNTHYDSRNNCNAIIETATNRLVMGCSSTVIPNTVTGINQGAFDGAVFTSIVIPNSVTAIDWAAFGMCKNLTSITLSNSLLTLGDAVFVACSSLVSIILPASLTSMGSSLFYDCTSLTEIHSEASLPPSSGTYTFSGLPASTKVYVPCDNVTDYRNAPQWGQFDICLEFGCPVSVTASSSDPATGTVSISGNGEYQVGQTVTLTATPNCVYHFDGWKTVNGVTVSIDNPYSFTVTQDTTLIAEFSLDEIYSSVAPSGQTLHYSVDCSDMSATLNCPEGYGWGSYPTPAGDLVIPSTITLDNNTFTVTGIYSYTFQNNTDLTSVTIPATVTYIAYEAFADCDVPVVYMLGTEPPSISSGNFEGTTVVKVPCDAVAAYESAWSNQNIDGAAPVVTVTSNNGSYGTAVVTTAPTCSSSSATVTATPNCGYRFVNWKNSNNETVSTEASYSFIVTDPITLTAEFEAETISEFDAVASSGQTLHYTVNTDGTSVTLSGHEDNISGDLAIPENVIYCNNSYSVTKIANNTFNNCSGLTSITLPGTITFIGNDAFRGCLGLTKTNFAGTIEQWLAIAFSNYYSTPLYFTHNLYFNDVELTSLVIPDNITEIKQYAFYYCASLSGALIIPNTVTSIGESAFSSCSGLTSVTLPENLTTIEEGVFSSCSGLTSIDIPATVISIGSNAFRYCNHITSVTIPHQVTYIGHYAFGGCSSLNTVTLGASVNRIGSGAFYPCNALRFVYVYPTTPPTFLSQPPVTYNPFFRVSSTKRTFYIPCGTTAAYSASEWPSSDNYTEVWNPYNIVINGDNQQMESSNVEIVCNTTVNISVTPKSGFDFDRWNDGNTDNPRTVTTTQDSSFTAYFIHASATVTATSEDDAKGTVTGSGTYSLGATATLTAIPDCGYRFVGWKNSNNETVSTDAEYSFTATEDITLTAQFESIPNIGVFSSVTPSGHTLYYYLNGSTAYVVSQNTTSPRYSDLSGDLVIPDYVTINCVDFMVNLIDDSAFYGCTDLTSVSIPNTVYYIGDHAFQNCSGLTTIAIPNSVTRIRSYTFDGCSSLSNIIIPNSVSAIRTAAFRNCSSLSSINVPNTVSTIEVSAFSGCNSLSSFTIPYLVTQIDSYTFKDCSSLSSIIIPNSVSKIRYHAFENCSSLTSISIPNSVTSIEFAAFKGCSGLTSITIPNHMTVIENSTFYGCSSLSSVTIPNSVTQIGEFAFSHCNSLMSIELPNSVTSIGGGAFSRCAHLVSVTLPNSLISIGGTSFAGCNNLTSIEIPNSVTDLGSGAFRECNNLTSVTIGNSITNIEGSTFIYCHNLQTLTLGSSVTNIEGSAFYECSGLRTIYCMPIAPPALNSDFWYTILNICRVYVPCGSVDDYRTAERWSSFTNIQEVTGCPRTVTVAVNDETMGSVIGGGTYTDGATATLTATPNCGYRFVHWNDDNTENPRSLTVIEDTMLTAEFEAMSTTDIERVCSNGQTLVYTINCDDGTAILTGYAGDCIGDVVIPEYITVEGIDYPVVTIARDAFGYSYLGNYISSVIVSNSVTTIEEGAFYGCENLESVHIGSSVSAIGSGGTSMFELCPLLATITVDPNNTTYDSRNNCNAIIETANNRLIVGSTQTVIPDDVVAIGHWAFFGRNITSITIPSSVSSIERAAFMGSSLNSLTLANAPLEIWEEAFEGCSLSSLYIPASVLNIQGSAFADNGNLTSIVVDPDNPYYDSRDNCNAIIRTEYNTLVAGCSSTIIPNTVTTLGYFSFHGMNYDGLTIPEFVTTIEDFVFNIDVNASMRVLSVTPPTISADYTFDNMGVPENKCDSLYVPVGTVETYLASAWNQHFTHIVEIPAPASTDTVIYVKLGVVGDSIFSKENQQTMVVTHQEVTHVKLGFRVEPTAESIQLLDQNETLIGTFEDSAEPTQIYRLTTGTYIIRAVFPSGDTFQQTINFENVIHY